MIGEFTPNPQDSPEQKLWMLAFACVEEMEALQAEADREYDALAGVDVQSLGIGKKRSEYGERQQAYFEILSKIESLRGEEEMLLALIEKVTDGTAPRGEIEEFLEGRVDRGLAPGDARNYLRESGGENSANRTRLTTGRNLSRVSFGKGSGTDSVTAEAQFYFMTADTHGGKLRNHGNKKANGAHYTGASGKRIRKF